MTKASITQSRSESQSGTINPDEAAHFGALAEDWWDPEGSSAMLHRLNPVRLHYIREAVDLHFGADFRSLRPLADRKALDVGCGAGLLCEPLARLGASVTGLDAAAENIAAAKSHAEGQGLTIDYRNQAIEDFGDSGFDLVTSLEVIEHVEDRARFVAGLAEALSEDGLMVLSTPNRTTMSKLLLVELAERTGRIPRGTHHHDQFLTPEELTQLLQDAGLNVTDVTGISYSPASGFSLSDNLSLNYLVTAVRA